MKVYCNLLSLILLGIGINVANAQVINGPSPANIGTTQTYSFNNWVIYSSQSWGSNGVMSNPTRIGTTYYIDITWLTGGSGYVTFFNQSYQPVTTKNVTVNCVAPPTPVVASFTYGTNTCGNKSISYSETPPNWASWYMQTSSGGTSTSSAGSPHYASTAGTNTYYLKARANGCSTWSSSISTAPVTVNPLPSSPGISVGSGSCGPRVLSKSGTIPGGVSWFWQGTNSGGQDYTSGPATATTYSASIHGTNNYYLSARNNATGCWSPAAGANVTIDNPLPPNPNSFQYCEWESMALTTTGYLSTLKWYNSSSQLVHTGVTYTPSNLDVGNHTYNVKNVSTAGCEGPVSSPITLLVKNNCDSYLNWIESTSFGVENNVDGSPKAIASAKVYNDGFGATIQSQVKFYSTDQIFATQQIYDSRGEQTLSTLPAPINSNAFGYRHRFITNSVNNTPYSAADFDEPTTLNNPNPVGANGQGSLGWYYSSSNSLEPNAPVSNYPYLRSWIEEGPDPKMIRSGGAAVNTKFGSGHEGSSEKFQISSGEIDHYFKLRGLMVPTPTRYMPNLLSNISVGTISNFVGQFANLSGASNTLTVTCNQASSSPKPGVFLSSSIPVIPGNVYTFKVKGYKNSSGADVALRVESSNGATIIVSQGALLSIGGSTTEKWISSTFEVPPTVTTIKVGLLWTNPIVNNQFFISGLDLRAEIPVSSIGYKFVDTDPEGNKVVSFVDVEGKTMATAVVVSTSGNPPVFTYDFWNYTYYNDIGQIVATVAPNGINLSSVSFPSFWTGFKYDHVGRLIEVNSSQEGITRFVYSTDGKIRFSQDQEQFNASPKRFLYSNYDYSGRLIESGEYSMSGTGFYVFESSEVVTPSSNSVLTIVDNTIPPGYDIENLTSVVFTGPSRVLDAVRCTDYKYVKYDKQASDLPGSDPLHDAQVNVLGKISKTQNANSATWYCYDEFGQIKWTKQNVSGLGYKTVDYTHDYKGFVSEVAYQKGQSDAFYHHYTYDADHRLTEVRTSFNGIDKTLHATYQYYLHGALKRVELASSSCKQGIDYVFTIEGSLKSINSSEPSTDPGRDGITGVNSSNPKDFFGETLHYNDADFTGATNATFNPTQFSISSSFLNHYAGNVRAISYHNATDFKNSLGENARHIYGYQYDSRNQLSTAQWGNVNGSASVFGESQRESIGGYDKNGNIQFLTRKGNLGTIIGDYTYVYEANSNRLDKINITGSSSVVVDYTYNAIGQMTQQNEGSPKIFNVKYDASGLVKEVRDNSNNLLQTFSYDEGGSLIKKESFTSGVLAKTFFYVGDIEGNTFAIYEKPNGGAVQLIERPIYGKGRIATYKPLVSTYFYEISDRLGNVRVLCGLPLTSTYSTNFESATNSDFSFYSSHPYDLVDHTDAGTTYQKVQFLNGGVNGRVGLAKSLAVSPGDQISATVYAKYRNLGAANGTAFLPALAAAFGVSASSVGNELKIYNSLSQFASTVPAGDHVNDDEGAPKVFVTILLFDKNYNFIDAAWEQITTVGVQNSGTVKEPPHDQLTKSYTVQQPGFAYVFLSNEHPYNVEAYFDDFSLVHTQSPIVGGSDYYPFGLPMDGMEITDEPYRYGYQGQFSEKNSVTGWNEFDLRMYDARFGRWMSPDPEGQFFSPYLAMGNNPVLSVDPDGGYCCGGVATDALTQGIVESAVAGANAYVMSLRPFPRPNGGLIFLPESTVALRTLGPVAINMEFNSSIASNPKSSNVFEPSLKAPRAPTSNDLLAGIDFTRHQGPNSPVITQWKQNSWYPIAQSDAFLDRMGYTFFNGIYLTVQMFTTLNNGDIRSLDGSYPTSRERVEGFANTATIALPAKGFRNPWGRRGSPPHVAKVAEVQSVFERLQFEHLAGGTLPEQMFNGRYADLIFKNPTTGEKVALQVGKVTKRNKPVWRERRAIKDLRASKQFRHIFFFKY